MPSTMSGYSRSGSRTTSYSNHGQWRRKGGGDYPRLGEGHGYYEGPWYGVDGRSGHFKQKWRGRGGAGYVRDHGQHSYEREGVKEVGSSRNQHQESIQYKGETHRYGRNDDGGSGRKDMGGGFGHYGRWDQQLPGERRGQQQYGERHGQGGQQVPGERHGLGEQQKRGERSSQEVGQQERGGRHSQGDIEGRGERHGQYVREGRNGRHAYDVNYRNTRHGNHQYGRRMEVSHQYRRSTRGLSEGPHSSRNGGRESEYDGECGSVFKLTNIPTSVGLDKLRSILQQREVGEFYITRSGVGEVNVKFREDIKVVVDKLKGLKIDECIVKKEAIYHKSDPVSPQLTDNTKNQIEEVMCKVPAENLSYGNDVGDKVSEDVGPQDDHIHDWSTEADQDQDRDQKQVGFVRIDKTSKHDAGTVKSDSKKGYEGLIEGKVKPESQNCSESNSAKKKKRKNQKTKDKKRSPDNWALYKFSNLPDTVTVNRLKRALRDRMISGGLNINELCGGIGLVSIQNGLQMKTLKSFKMGGQNIEIELVETEPALDAIHETKSNSLKFSPPKPEETYGLDVPPARIKVPEHVTEDVMRDVTGLNSFVPEFCEIREGEVAFVFKVDKGVLEKIRAFSDSCIEDTILLKDVSVKEGSEEDPSYVVEESESCVENVVEIVDQGMNGSKVETPNNADDVERSQPEVLIPVEAVFPSMDVREKVKVIEQAKNKSLGDFLVQSKAPQGQLKKKKKKRNNNKAPVLEVPGKCEGSKGQGVISTEI